jgi:hypothetical protein
MKYADEYRDRTIAQAVIGTFGGERATSVAIRTIFGSTRIVDLRGDLLAAE